LEGLDPSFKSGWIKLHFVDFFCVNLLEIYRVLTHMTQNRMFPLTLRTTNLIQPYAQSATTPNETMVWHTRFGHLPFQSLSLLQNHSMVKGLPIFKEKNSPCESCILGKHNRTSFPQSSTQAKQHLELVHTDLCGPMQT
jgi:hypothetical protein